MRHRTLGEVLQWGTAAPLLCTPLSCTVGEAALQLSVFKTLYQFYSLHPLSLLPVNLEMGILSISK